MDFNRIESLADQFGIVLMYLFGSQSDEGRRYLEGAEPSVERASDLDIAVAFEHPPKEPMRVYGSLYSSLGDIFEPYNIDLVFMHEVDTLFHYEIIRGIRIYAKDENSADAFEERVMQRAGDLLFKKKMMNRDIMEAVENGYFAFEYRAGS